MPSADPTTEGLGVPIHDWTKVYAGVFHDFHHLWITSVRGALNGGLLPPGYYAMADQVAGPGIPDVLGLQRAGSDRPTPDTPGSGSTAVAAALPSVRFHDTAVRRPPRRRPKRIAVRHVTGDRVVALVEIVSPSNKRGPDARSFATKLATFLADGIHLLVLDLLPPTPRHPNGIHPLVWSHFKRAPFALPPGKPLTLAAYAARRVQEAFVEPVAVGDALPPMPLFLTPDTHVLVPLEATYQKAWVEVPPQWRDVLEPPAP